MKNLMSLILSLSLWLFPFPGSSTHGRCLQPSTYSNAEVILVDAPSERSGKADARIVRNLCRWLTSPFIARSKRDTQDSFHLQLGRTLRITVTKH